MKLLNARRRRAVADAVIADPEEHTVMDDRGAVRSVQAANVTMPAEQLEAIWSAMYLERLARTYWRFLSQITLGLIRIAYTSSERAVVLVARPLVLLRFYAPEYELDAERGIVRWRIRDGVLVSRAGRGGDGFLEIDVRRCPEQEPGRATVRVEVEVANFYPSIASGLSSWLYQATQSRIHVLVTHGFLRSLARLELEESRVGRFAVTAPDDHGGATPEPGIERSSPQSTGRAPAPDPGPRAETVEGTNPWPAVAAIGAALAALALLGGRRLR